MFQIKNHPLTDFESINRALEIVQNRRVEFTSNEKIIALDTNRFKSLAKQVSPTNSA